MEETNQKRRYVSDLRQANAEATRLRIAEAARALMLERGYAATTMTEVAQSAGVAVQTLYSSCPGGKPALAKLVYDVTLAGDAQPIAQRARPEVQAIILEPGPVRKLGLYAEMATGILQRIQPVHAVLRAAAAATPGDTGLHELLDGIERQRRAGGLGLAAHLAALGFLRDGLSAELAADEIYALTSTELFERLTGTCRWSVPGYQEWLVRTLAATLLRPRPENI
jgi:AcrR family transcriptional regulator